MMTKKQRELLLFLDRHLMKNGVAPSFDEMKEALGLKSKSGIHRLITGLEERGFIRRLAHRARAIEVLRHPDVTETPEASARPGGFKPNVIRGRFPPLPAASSRSAEGDSVQLPLYGRIAAGTPIEALRDNSNFVDIPGSVLGSGEYYALEVDGDSMVEAGILDGDTVIIERADTADNGSIVVALIDNEEATLKRLRRKGSAIALEPANRRYETKIYPPERVSIQGRLVSLLRRY